MKKKRLPIEQLREAGRKARDLLVEKKIIAKDSFLDRMVQDKNAPMLPGIPAYLPHQWTLRAAQQMLYDLIVIWKAECVKTPKKVENITEFFKFVVIELRKQEKKFAQEEKKMGKEINEMKEVPVLKEIFSPVRKHEISKTIQRFFVDSFAVSLVLKENTSTSEYANWFLDWTENMRKIWSQADKIKEDEGESNGNH
jgi:hypothetical protein